MKVFGAGTPLALSLVSRSGRSAYFSEDMMSQVSSFNFVFDQVQQALHTKKPYEALRKLSEISNKCSKDMTYLTLLAKTQIAINDLDSLIKTRQEIVRQRGSNEDQMTLMLAYYQVNLRNQALDVGLQLQAKNMTFTEEQKLCKLLVKIYLEENDFEGAQEVITNSILSESDDFLLWAQGIIYLNADRKDKALDYFRKAVQLNKNNDQAWVSLGMMHKEMGDESLSIANIEKAIDLNPYNTSALKLLTNSTVRNSDKMESAFEHLRYYLAEFCFDEDISLCHVQMLCQLKQWSIAELEVEKLLLHEPQNEAVKNIKKSMFDAQVM